MKGNFQFVGQNLVWPAVTSTSANDQEMRSQGFRAHSEQVSQVQMGYLDTCPGRNAPLTFYDVTHPEARRYIWEQVRGLTLVAVKIARN